MVDYSSEPSFGLLPWQGQWKVAWRRSTLTPQQKRKWVQWSQPGKSHFPHETITREMQCCSSSGWKRWQTQHLSSSPTSDSSEELSLKIFVGLSETPGTRESDGLVCVFDFFPFVGFVVVHFLLQGTRGLESVDLTLTDDLRGFDDITYSRTCDETSSSVMALPETILLIDLLGFFYCRRLWTWHLGEEEAGVWVIIRKDVWFIRDISVISIPSTCDCCSIDISVHGGNWHWLW